jgi:hypothetical protein
MKETDVRADEQCTNELAPIAQLQRINPVTVPADIQLEKIEPDTTGPHAHYWATKRAIEAFPGGIEVVALHLGLEPEMLAKRIAAMHDHSGHRGLTANDLQKIVRRTGDITPMLTLTSGRGIEFFKTPQLEISKSDLAPGTIVSSLPFS